MVCFESELVLDWPRIARTIKDLGRRNDCGGVFWNFIDFVVTQRSPLFILLMPFIMQKLSLPPGSDADRHLQFVIREKMQGFNLPMPKSKGSLLMDLAHEMKEMKEELDDRKYEQDAKKRAGGDAHSESQTLQVGAAGGHHPATTRHRPSIIELFTGGSSGSGGGDSGGSRFPHSHLTTDMQPLHRTTGDTSTIPLSPNSPTEEGTADVGGHPKPRLQRSKAQSRKTFRLRKSRKSHIEVSHIKVEPQEIPRVGGSQLHADEPLELSVAGMPSGGGTCGLQASSSTSSSSAAAHMSAIAATTMAKIRHHSSLRKADPPSWDEDSAMSQTSSTSGYRESFGTAERYGLLVLESSPPAQTPLLPSTLLQNIPTTHTSTTVTSSQSIKSACTVPLLTPQPPHTPPLASPDAHELASTSSTSREPSGNYGSPHNVPGGSSVESLNSGEDTALLKKSEKGDSHQSLLMVFETQDEDTLI